MPLLIGSDDGYWELHGMLDRARLRYAEHRAELLRRGLSEQDVTAMMAPLQQFYLELQAVLQQYRPS